MAKVIESWGDENDVDELAFVCQLDLQPLLQDIDPYVSYYDY